MDAKMESEILERLAKVEQKVNNQCEKCEYVSKDMNKKITDTQELLQEMKTLNITVTRLTEQLKSNNKEVEGLKKNIETLTQKPSNYWDKVVTTIISVVTSGIVGALIALMLK